MTDGDKAFEAIERVGLALEAPACAFTKQRLQLRLRAHVAAAVKATGKPG